MKKEYCLDYGTNVIFGRGKRNVLLEKLQSFERKFVMCGNHFYESSHCRELFKDSNDCFIYIVPGAEPTLKSVENALDAARQYHADCIIAIGGGSVMDCGKSVAALFYQQGNIRDYFYSEKDFDDKRAFFCALPTSAGTGAEVTPNAVLTDELNNIKQSLRGKNVGVDLAIVDPELTYDCPLNVIRQSGMDALTQAIEGAISNKANSATFAWSMQAFKLIFDNLRMACSGDESAKDAVAEGTMLGALAFVKSGLGAVHGLAHPIGSLYHIGHGLVCGILLGHILKINRDFLNNAAKNYYGPAGTADMLINDIIKLADDMQIPHNFKGYLKKEDFPFIIKNCRSGSMKANPVYLSDSDIERLLESLI